MRKGEGILSLRFCMKTVKNTDDDVNYDAMQVDAILNFTTNVVLESFINSLVSERTVFVDFGRSRGISFVQDHLQCYVLTLK